MEQELLDSVIGCIVAGAIGDAAGAAFEGRDDVAFDNLREMDWHLTDDTQLTLATCEAIVEAGHPDPESIASSFLKWFRARRLTGLGASTLKALQDLDAGAHWALSGRKGDRAAGNGAAMRIAPLAFCLDPADDDSHRLIRDTCRITHHSDESWIGALAVVHAIRFANDQFSLEQIAQRLPQTSVRDRLLEYAKLPVETVLPEAAKRFGASGFVVESVPFALFAAQKAEALGFAGMLEQIIVAGGDTDSNASIAGQVVGARIGLRNLPIDLLDNLPQRDMVFQIAESFGRFVVANRPCAPQC